MNNIGYNEDIDKCLLTVIIPVHNTVNYLKRCIESVLNQNLKSIKIIIIDDASSDGTSDIVEYYERKYPYIKSHRNNDRNGPGYSRNVGLSLTDTKYVAFLDSDDWIDSSAYWESIYELENDESIQIAIFGIKTEYNSPEYSSSRYKYKYKNIISNSFALSMLCKTHNLESYISALLGSKVFRTDLLKENKILFGDVLFEDNAFTFKAFAKSKKLVIIPDVYLHYYQRERSIMHSFSKKHIDDFFKGFVELRNFLKENSMFDLLRTEYYAFFEKCYKSLLNSMFASEQSASIQKKYILYFLKIFQENFDIDDYIDFIDINHFYSFLNKFI